MRIAHSERARSLLVAVAYCVCLAACAPAGVAPDEPQAPAASAPPPAQESRQPPSDAPAPNPVPPPAAEIPSVSDPSIDGLCEGRRGLSVATADPASWDSPAQRRTAAAVQCDAYEIMMRVSELGSSAAAVTALHARVRELTELALQQIRASPAESSRLPLSPPHQQMYEVAAEAERTAGAAGIEAWSANPWQPLDPLDRAKAGAPRTLSTALMRGERRAIALNLRSSSPGTRTVQIQIRASGLAASALQIYRVNWTGNDLSSWAAAELEPLGDALHARETTLLPGVTQQIWIQLHPDAAAAAGRFEGSVSLISDDGPATVIPLAVRVFKGRLPRPSLHFGGWDYADGRTDRNYTGVEVDQGDLVKHLQERYVDTPWARRHVMPWAPSDVVSMEAWLSQWTEARRFRIFLNVGQDIGGVPLTDDRFGSVVAGWAQSWADEIRRLGKSPEQFDLLLVDEPAVADQARVTELWAQAIRRSGAGFRIWSDPVWPDPFATPRSLIDAADTVAINIGIADRVGTAYWEWARELAREGKALELYGCEGPARRLDPYAYYRLTMWRAFFVGATAVSFWSFADTGGSASDDEFGAARYNYSPLFISPRILPGKHMEAAMEGIEDTQYLEMMRNVASTHRDSAVRERATGLLNDASAFVERAPRSSDAQWMRQLESTEADRRRLAMGELLDSLLP